MPAKDRTPDHLDLRDAQARTRADLDLAARKPRPSSEGA
jgi:hypothetical protein